MFTNQDEYTRAIENSGIYTYENGIEKSDSKLINIFMVGIFICMSFLGYSYMKHETDFFKKMNISSKDATDIDSVEKDRKLIAILNKTK